MRRTLGLVAAIAALAAGMVAAPGGPGVAADPPDPAIVVLSPEDNRLNAYDAATFAKQTVIEAVHTGNPGGAVGVTPETLRRDINGQVCADPDDPRRFIAGEDTEQGEGVPAGWGYFELTGDQVGALQASQLGRLVPDFYLGTPENYGCGFLPGQRLVTTAVGDQLPTEPANGQLILWFGPFDAPGRVPHCNLDTTLGTAGGIHVDGETIYVATNRGGVFRYTFPNGLPASESECATKPPLRQQFGLPLLPFSPTPSAIVPSGRGTFYVSSVFTGTVGEYSAAGQFQRYVLSPPLGLPIGQLTGITPFGMAVTPDGTLWVADIGIVGTGPVDGNGSVVMVRFDAAGRPLAPQTIDSGLTFPDGLGVMDLGAAQPERAVGSQWPCGHWGMYGRSLTRVFSTDCPSGITEHTVLGLLPAWTFRPPLDLNEQAAFTASPVVVDGVVYIGGWDGIMYAIDAESGALRWTFQTADAPGATFGPIVSSAAVAEVRIAGDLRRLVIFGSGPLLYALDAFTGELVWSSSFGDGSPDDPAELESSPVVWGNTVYVGMDVHNQPGRGRGGLLAVDARTGALLWKFEPEAAAGVVGEFGCGGVWSSPTLDVDTGLVYFGTANCPAVTPDNGLPMEAVYALNAETGALVWRFGPEDDGSDEDEDFGATPNLFRDDTGRKVLGAGRKDGTYYALDPATGAVLWATHVTDPLPGVGGFIGSSAVFDGDVYGSTALGSVPAYHALDGATGAVRWQALTTGPSYAGSAVVNGVVFAGALDATLKAFDADTGLPLWASPTLGPISSAPAVVSDMVFVGSGTSTSDLCAKDQVYSELCFFVFDTVLGQLGGVHAFRLVQLPPIP